MDEINLRRKRHRCAICGKLSSHTHSINGSPWVCFDGHYETMGFDNRTIDGTPLWEGGKPKGKIEFGMLIT